MSYADRIFKDNCREILTHGVWDTDQNVRPHWEDGTPAHTVKKFGIINRYDLKAEFPILTIRRTYFKTCIDELLWIWQQKSNNIHDLRGHIWDSWACLLYTSDAAPAGRGQNAVCGHRRGGAAGDRPVPAGLPDRPRPRGKRQ